MKWKNHMEIARAVAQALTLSPVLASILVEGSVQPDKEADKIIRVNREKTLYRARMAHHRADRRFIMNLIWKARRDRLEGRDEDAVWCLGRALHYVEDLCVATAPFGMSHDSREEAIGRHRVNENAIMGGIRNSLNSPHFVWRCLLSLRSKRDPEDALFQAAMYAAAISASVLGPVRPPRHLMHEIRGAKLAHWLIFLPLASALAAIFVYLAFTLQPLLVLAAPLLFLMTLLADRRYAYLRKEARWFGMEPREPATIISGLFRRSLR